MTSKPLVTIIVASYNSAQTLLLALKSIQSQDMDEFEVRVVGDHSTDESDSVVASLNDPRFFWANLESRCGVQSGPNNLGLKQAQGKYIAYLGHDDLWFPWHLSSLLNCIEETQADFTFSLSALIAPQGVRNFTGPLASFAPPSTWLHRKSLIETSGFWREDVDELNLPVDREFWKRAVDHNKTFHFHPSLSVLKFPSPWWKLYGLKENFPQIKFAIELEKSPQHLQTKILSEGIFYLTRSSQNKWKQWLKKIAYRYGLDKAPLSIILKWHFQRKRKKNLKLRGL
jgi:glycosyltransferase involved in cell wall biosynthesis